MIQRIVSLILWIMICLFAGSIGTIFSIEAIADWYIILHKPPLTPPNWIFGPVWTILYILMAVAANLVWEKGFKDKGVRTAITVFLVQLILNTLWSVIFFGVKNPWAAFVVIVAMWLSIAWTIMKFYRISKTAAWLLIPYILWVSFAAYLNLGVALLN